MKRRILSLFISLALCLTLCPAPALAEGGVAVNPAQTVTGGETPENTEPAESTPGGVQQKKSRKLSRKNRGIRK